MYIFISYQYLPYHNYIILKIESDHHNIKEYSIAGDTSSSCIWVLIFYIYTKDITFYKIGHYILYIDYTNIRSFSIFNNPIYHI